MILREDATAGVVAALDDLAPGRLGILLCGARRQGSLTRRAVAKEIGTTAGVLRRCERGHRPAQSGLVAALANCYGEDLTEQLARRTPVRVRSDCIVIGTEEIPLDSNDTDAVLAAYLGIVARLRRTTLEDPIALRADDLAALAPALGHDAEYLEARISEILARMSREVRSLQAESRRRKVIVPVAGLATGIAVVAGVGCRAASRKVSPPRTAPTHQVVVGTTSMPPRPVAAATTPVTTRAPTTTSVVVLAVAQAVRPITQQTAGAPVTTATVDIGTALSVRATTTTTTTTLVAPPSSTAVTTSTSVPETTTTTSP